MSVHNSSHNKVAAERMINAFSLEIFRNIFTSIADEMGSTLERTASSPNIKERRDFSCALFDSHGKLIAQAAHIPVHLGSMPLLLLQLVSELTFVPGDMVITNDPYSGGTHLPDISLVAPVFLPGEETRPFAFVANRAHHSDIGGISAGSMPISTEIFQEGIIIPPVRLMKDNGPQGEVWQFIIDNVRTPDERRGDLEAQVAANRVGQRRLIEVIQRYGAIDVDAHMQGLLSYSEQLTSGRLFSLLPHGTFCFQDYLRDFQGKSIILNVTITVSDDSVTCDFTGTSPQGPHCLNAPRAVTYAAVYYVFRCLSGEDIPPNAGCFRPIKIMIPPDSLLNARFPAAVAGGNVETSQRIVDVVIGALAKALPDLMPAASQGTMNNISIGGYDERRRRYYTYYETMGGGAGASKSGKGASALHTHMSNTQNTPIEVLEMEYPFAVREYSLRRRSGGEGVHCGGDGLCREFSFESQAQVTLLSERRIEGPYGLSGGLPGKKGENTLIRNGKKKKLPSKFSILVEEGDILRIETPGGGGWGETSRVK
jgi:N-methylhydantoinase B